MTDAKVVDAIAENYVKLVLAMGEQDADYVDAYYGRPEWKAKAAEEKKPLATIREEAMDLFSQLSQVAVPAREIDRLRRESERACDSGATTERGGSSANGDGKAHGTGKGKGNDERSD